MFSSGHTILKLVLSQQGGSGATTGGFGIPAFESHLSLKWGPSLRLHVCYSVIVAQKGL
jgi:hypothetical protein